MENPKHILAQMNMGSIYQELKLIEEAEKAYLKTLAVNPFYIFGSLNLARLYVFSGQPDKAISLIKSVLEWYRGDHELSLFLGLAYAFKKDAKRAIKEFETSLRWKPNYSLAHFYLGVQLQYNDRSSAKRHLQSFLHLTKNESEHRNLISKAEQLLKKL